MSVFVGAAQPQFILRHDDDERAGFGNPRMELYRSPFRLDVDMRVMQRAQRLVQPFMPSSLLGDMAVDFGELAISPWILPPPVPSGANGRLGFNGFTRDASGGVIAGVTVKLFLTATDVKQSETVSNADGLFVVSTAAAGAHYLLFYKTGTPDISGTTVNTMLGA